MTLIEIERFLVSRPGVREPFDKLTLKEQTALLRAVRDLVVQRQQEAEDFGRATKDAS